MQRDGYLIQSAATKRIIIRWLPDRKSALEMADQLACGIGCAMNVWQITTRVYWLIYVALTK